MATAAAAAEAALLPMPKPAGTPFDTSTRMPPRPNLLAAALATSPAVFFAAELGTAPCGSERTRIPFPPRNTVTVS